MPDGGLGLVIDRLACPICGELLALAEAIVRCPAGHSFDVARQGYVSLFGGGARAHTGDDHSMVTARERFLEWKVYAPIAQAVSEAIPEDAKGLCVDLAGGTGYYLRAVLDAHPGLTGLVLELSTAALKRAAQGHERIAAVGADVWQPLPIRSGAVACLLSVFGPRNPAEIRRVLRRGGLLLVVTPTVRHLAELVGPLGLVTVDDRKQERLEASLHEFSRRSEQAVEYTVELGPDAALDSILMGPSAHHTTQELLAEKVAALPQPLIVTVSVRMSVYSNDG